MEHPIYKEMRDKLPEGFTFPQAYLDLISHEEPNLRPWGLLYYQEDHDDGWLKRLKRNFPDRHLIPFAVWTWGIKKLLACFEYMQNQEQPRILFIYPFPEPDLKVLQQYESFEDWLAKAKEESREYWANLPELPYVPPAKKLPEGFRFPQAYLDFITLESMETMYPWTFLCQDPEGYDNQVEILQEIHPGRQLVPFARYDINGDLACFEVLDDPARPVVNHATPFADSYTNYWDDREEYLPAVLLEREPFPSFESWLDYAEVCNTFHHIDEAGNGVFYALKGIRNSLQAPELEALEKRVPGFSDTLEELLRLFKVEDTLTFEDMDRGPQEGEEEYYSRKLAELQELYEKENYKKGLPLLVPFLLKTGLTLPARVVFYVKWLTYHLDLEIPQLDELGPDEENS